MSPEITITSEELRERVEDRPFIIHCQYPRHVRPPETSVEIVLAPRSAVQSPARSADPQPASSKSFPPRTGAAERRTSMAASGLLRIRPPVLEAAEPGEKDGVG